MRRAMMMHPPATSLRRAKQSSLSLRRVVLCGTVLNCELTSCFRQCHKRGEHKGGSSRISHDRSNKPNIQTDGFGGYSRSHWM